MNSSLKLVLSMILLLPVLSSTAEAKETTPFERTVTKSFTVSNGATVNINNKYGGITLHTWGKNEIHAVIKIKANGNSLEDAKQLANQVAIKGSQSGNTVSLETQYDSNTGSSFWKQFFGGSSKTGRKYIHIDYDVYIPQSLAATRIKNNYGNVIGDQIPGDLYVDMNYGAFHLSNIAGKLSLSSNYCEGSLNDIKTGTLRANYTDFSIEKAGNMDIQSNYSDYRITNAGTVSIRGNYGDITGDVISSIDGKTTYSDYKINKLTSGGTIISTYGDIYIKTLGEQFRGLTIHPTYSDIKIGLPNNLSVKLDISLVSGDIHTGSLPMQIAEKTDQHGRSTLKATVKGVGSNTSVIRIEGTYCDVTFSEK